MISISLNRFSGRRCFLSPVTISCASAANPHSRIISSPGSGVAPSVRSVGKTKVAASDRVPAQSTCLWLGYSRRSSSIVSWYSAKSSGLTKASQRPSAHLERQSNGAPRQKIALATTLVSKTTFTPYFGSEHVRSPEKPRPHPRGLTPAFAPLTRALNRALLCPCRQLSSNQGSIDQMQPLLGRC
jgi:hypothetical protein